MCTIGHCYPNMVFPTICLGIRRNRKIKCFLSSISTISDLKIHQCLQISNLLISIACTGVLKVSQGNYTYVWWSSKQQGWVENTSWWIRREDESYWGTKEKGRRSRCPKRLSNFLGFHLHIFLRQSTYSLSLSNSHMQCTCAILSFTRVVCKFWISQISFIFTWKRSNL